MYIDCHSHLDFDEFADDRAAVIERARVAGVERIIVSATTAQRWHCVNAVANDYPTICLPAYGLHPMFMAEHQALGSDTVISGLKTQLKQSSVVAIGEIGLDFFIDNPQQQAQIELFVAQLKLADAFDLPVIIHARKALDIVLKHLRQFPRVRGIIHSFSGSAQQAEQLIERGFYLSFGGPITYSRATRLHKLLQTLPLERLLIESDAPDQPDAKHHQQQQRNEPAYIIAVAEKIAELKHLPLTTVAKQTRENAIKAFRLNP